MADHLASGQCQVCGTMGMWQLNLLILSADPPTIQDAGGRHKKQADAVQKDHLCPTCGACYRYDGDGGMQRVRTFIDDLMTTVDAERGWTRWP